MKKTTTSQAALASQNDLRCAVAGAWEAVGQSFDQFCLLAGVSALCAGCPGPIGGDRQPAQSCLHPAQ